MSRYIDADMLYVDWYDSFVADDGTEYDNIPFISKGQIDDVPSIDIVFCCECKHRGICFGRLVQGTEIVQLNFCSCGERGDE